MRRKQSTSNRWHDNAGNVLALWVALLATDVFIASRTSSDLAGIGMASGMWSLPMLAYGTWASLLCVFSSRRNNSPALTAAVMLAPVAFFLLTSLAWDRLPSIR
jgi:hypothetical protein